MSFTIEVFEGPAVLVEDEPSLVVVEVPATGHDLVILETSPVALEVVDDGPDLIIETEILLEVLPATTPALELVDGTALTVLEFENAVVEVITEGPQGRPGVGGSFNVRQIITADTADYGDMIEADATAGQFSVTLPAPVTNQAPIRIKKVDESSNAVVVLPADGGLIDDFSNYTLFAPKMSADFVCNGTNWQVA